MSNEEIRNRYTECDFDILSDDINYEYNHELQRTIMYFYIKPYFESSTKLVTNGNVAAMIMDLYGYNTLERDENLNPDDIYPVVKCDEFVVYVDPKMSWGENKIFSIDGDVKGLDLQKYASQFV